VPSALTSPAFNWVSRINAAHVAHTVEDVLLSNQRDRMSLHQHARTTTDVVGLTVLASLFFCGSPSAQELERSGWTFSIARATALCRWVTTRTTSNGRWPCMVPSQS